MNLSRYLLTQICSSPSTVKIRWNQANSNVICSRLRSHRGDKKFKLIFLNVWPFLINFFLSHEEPNSIKFQEISPLQFPRNPRAPLKNITNHNWSVKIRFSADEKKSIEMFNACFPNKIYPNAPTFEREKKSKFLLQSREMKPKY